MKILFIDTSLKDVSIATYESSKLLSVISECIPNMHSIYTIPYIDRCLTESKIDKKEVEKIMQVDLEQHAQKGRTSQEAIGELS